MRIRSILSIILLSLLPVVAAADPPILPPAAGGGGQPQAPAGGLFAVTADSVAAIFKEFNVTAETGTVGQPPVPAMRINLRGFTVMVIFYGCGNGCDSFQMSVSNKAPSHVNLAYVNAYNTKWRFTKLYLDGQGNYHFDMDVNVAGGVTRDNVISNIKLYDYLLGELSK